MASEIVTQEFQLYNNLNSSNSMKSTHYNNREHALGSKNLDKIFLQKNTPEQFEETEEEEEEAEEEYYSRITFKLDSQSVSQSTRSPTRRGDACKCFCGKLIFVMSRCLENATSSR
jgi:hypothetical protein